MPSVRNLRRLGGLVCVLALLGLGAAVLRPRSPEEPSGEKSSQEGGAVEDIKGEPDIRFPDEPPTRLVPGKGIARTLAGGQGHRYEFALEAGELGRVVAEQKGVDLALRFHRPDRERPIEIDSPNWKHGPEVVYEIASGAQVYLLEVVCADPAAEPGEYEIFLDSPRIADAADQKSFEAWKQFRNGELRRQAGAFQEALAKYEQSLALWREVGDPAWEAETFYRIGWMHQDLGNPARAVEALDQALPRFRQLGSRREEGIVLNRIGANRIQLGEAEVALRAHQEALVIFEAEDQPHLVASALSNLGNAHLYLGESAKAEERFEQAIERARAAGVPIEELQGHLGIGLLRTYQGRLDDALDAFSRALRIQETGVVSPTDRAETLARMADVDKRLGRTEKAKELLRQALSLSQEAGARDSELVFLNSLGTVLLAEKDFAGAREAYRQALGISRETGNRSGEAFSLLNLGRFFYESGRPAEAFRFHEDAAALFRSVGSRRGEISTLYGSARALHQLGRYEEALQRLRSIPENVESLRSKSDSPDARGSYLATKQHYYELSIDVLMHLHELHPGAGHDVAALELNEQRRARSLLDLLSQPGEVVRRNAGTTLLARERDLRRHINEIEEAIYQKHQWGDDGAAAVKPLETKQAALLQDLEKVRADIAQSSPRRASLQAAPLNLAGLRSLIADEDDETLVVIYSLGKERSFLWAFGRRGGLISRSLPARAWIEDAAAAVLDDWRRAGGRRSASSRWARRLSESLLGPLAPHLGARRLILVPDGALRELPFAALPDPVDPAEPLLARHEIVSLPSGSTLAALRERLANRMEAEGDLAIFADAVFASGDPRLQGKAGPGMPPPPGEEHLTRSLRDLGLDRLDPLPHSRAEAVAISTFYKNDKLVALDFDASRQNATSGVLSRYKILHFATHGLLNPKRPELSGLVLSRFDRTGKPQEGLLLAYEISSLDLPAELVVLSACETGLGETASGEGVASLTQSFMDAGAPRIVVSLWKVSDEATAELMRRFYTGMIEHQLTPPAALRCAQLSMRRHEKWSDPFLWAPFIFQGDWNLPMKALPPKDGSIEVQVGGTKVGRFPDDDLPLPGDKKPPVCPVLDAITGPSGQEKR